MSAKQINLTQISANGSTSGQALTSNGTAVSWGSAGGASGGGTDKVFYENDANVTTNYTITTGKNAISAGPITINSDVVVTVPNNSVWVIV